MKKPDDLKWLLLQAGGRLRRTFYMALPENSRDYEDSRRAFILAATANQSILQFVSGTFLASLLDSLGVSDGNTGIIMSIATLATFSDLFTMNGIQKLRKRKPFICLMVLQKIWFAFLYLVPFTGWSAGTRLFWFICFMSAGQVCTQISTPAINDWIGSLVPPEKRGTYFSRKDAISVFATISAMLGMGLVFDRFRADSRPRSFLVMAGALLVLTLLNFKGYVRIKEPREYPLNQDGLEMHGSLRRRYEKTKGRSETGSALREIRKAFQSRNFRRALILTCFWNMAFYASSPFNMSYELKELKLSFTFIMSVTFLMSIARLFLTPWIGKKADRIGMAPMLERIFLFYAAGCFFMMLAVPQNGKIMFAISTVLCAVAWCFINSGLLCIQLEFLNREARMFQFAVITALSGLYGFGVSVLSGKLIDYLQKKPPVFAGKTLYAQQITNLIGMVLACGVVVYLSVCIEGAERLVKK